MTYTVTRIINGATVATEDLGNYTIIDPTVIDTVQKAIARHSVANHKKIMEQAGKERALSD